MSKSPAFQFYPKDWFGSENVRLMTPAERGGYIELLGHAWLNEDCSLPDDDKKLAILSGLGEQWFNGSSELIRSCFKKKGKRIVNIRLVEEQEKQEQWRKKCSDAGKKSGEARKNKDLEPKVSSTKVQRVVEPKGNIAVCSLQSSSASSIPSTKKTLKDISLFEDAWSRYPMKIGKKEAERHFNASVKTYEDYTSLIMAMDNYLEHLKLQQNSFKGKMNGSTWFNNWQDWVDWIEPESAETVHKQEKDTVQLEQCKKEAARLSDQISTLTGSEREYYEEQLADYERLIEQMEGRDG